MAEIAYRYRNRRQAADVVDTLLQMDGVDVDVFVIPGANRAGWVFVRARGPRGTEGQVEAAMRRHRGWPTTMADAEQVPLPVPAGTTEVYLGREGARFFRGYGFIKRAGGEE